MLFAMKFTGFEEHTTTTMLHKQNISPRQASPHGSQKLIPAQAGKI